MVKCADLPRRLVKFESREIPVFMELKDEEEEKEELSLEEERFKAEEKEVALETNDPDVEEEKEGYVKWQPEVRLVKYGTHDEFRNPFASWRVHSFFIKSLWAQLLNRIRPTLLIVREENLRSDELRMRFTAYRGDHEVTAEFFSSQNTRG
jgi:hypothetical protein